MFPFAIFFFGGVFTGIFSYISELFKKLRKKTALDNDSNIYAENGFKIDENSFDELEDDSAVEKKKPKTVNEIFEWLEVLISAIVAVVLIFSFFFRVATISGPSMENTLYNGEKIIISNFNYTPKYGDIVVISRNVTNSVYNIEDSQLPIIKRVIATEGQTVDIDFKSGTVTVDGKVLAETYIKEPTHLKYDIEFPVTVEEGCIFVLGDNRNDSLDSRSSAIGNMGMIDTKYILGRAIIRVFPINKFGGLSS